MPSYFGWVSHHADHTVDDRRSLNGFTNKHVGPRDSELRSSALADLHRRQGCLQLQKNEATRTRKCSTRGSVKAVPLDTFRMRRRHLGKPYMAQEVLRK